MKKLFASIVIIVFASVSLFAQTHSESEMVRSYFKLEKKVVVSDFLQLNDSLSKKFWPIYEKYEAERTVIGNRKIALLEKYANSYKNMDAATAKQLWTESASIQTTEASLRQKYANMVSKNVSPAAAINFYMVEDYIATAIKNELYGAIPAPLNK